MKSIGPYYSQFREDRILEEIFLGKETGVCAEVGANDGITGSNTYLFEKKGWKCILIEPTPELCQQIRQFRNCTVVQCAASSGPGEATFYIADSVGSWSALQLTELQKNRIAYENTTVREITVQKRTLDDILTESEVSAIDFVSIDVEGHEFEVLQGFSLERFRTRIIILEDNSNLANAEISWYMKEKGYKKFFRTGVNDWYCLESDPITSAEYVDRLNNYLDRCEFEDRVKGRFSYLNKILPDTIKNFLSATLHHISKFLFLPSDSKAKISHD